VKRLGEQMWTELCQRKWLVLALGLLLAGVAYWVIRGSDRTEDAIQERMDELQTLAGKDGPESKLESLGRARRAGTYVTDRPYLEVMRGGPVFDRREELVSFLAGMRSRVANASVSFRTNSLELLPGDDRARMSVTVYVTATIRGEKQSYRERYQIQWELIDERWQISSLELKG